MTEYKSKVKYEAPIEINIEEDFPDPGAMAVSEIENMICSAVLKAGITVDKEELIKALRYDRGQYEKGYADGKCDAAAAIEELEAEKKKTVTQIFCEEQAAWEGHCKDLMKQIRELQAKVKFYENLDEEWREKERLLGMYRAQNIYSAKDSNGNLITNLCSLNRSESPNT